MRRILRPSLAAFFALSAAAAGCSAKKAPPPPQMEDAGAVAAVADAGAVAAERQKSWCLDGGTICARAEPQRNGVVVENRTSAQAELVVVVRGLRNAVPRGSTQTTVSVLPLETGLALAVDPLDPTQPWSVDEVELKRAVPPPRPVPDGGPAQATADGGPTDVVPGRTAPDAGPRAVQQQRPTEGF